MNKNDRFHGIAAPEYENNENVLSEAALKNVAGGMDALLNGGAPICPRCGGWMQNMCHSNGTPNDTSDDVRVAECPNCHYSM